MRRYAPTDGTVGFRQMTLLALLLGEVAIEVDGRALDLGGLRQRSLVAILVLNRNHALGIEALTERMWPDEPPLTATKTIQVYVSRLRKLLDGEADRLASSPSGYVLRLADHELDVSRFDDAPGPTARPSTTAPSGPRRNSSVARA